MTTNQTKSSWTAPELTVYGNVAEITHKTVGSGDSFIITINGVPVITVPISPNASGNIVFPINTH